jgi:hypothetical protein
MSEIFWDNMKKTFPTLDTDKGREGKRKILTLEISETRRRK